jgi:hypothetical protein
MSMVPYKYGQPINIYQIDLEISNKKFFEELEKDVINGHADASNNPYGKNIFAIIKERSHSKLRLKSSDILVMERELYDYGILFTIKVPHDRPNYTPRKIKQKIAEVLEEVANGMGMYEICKKTPIL